MREAPRLYNPEAVSGFAPYRFLGCFLRLATAFSLARQLDLQPLRLLLGLNFLVLLLSRYTVHATR